MHVTRPSPGRRHLEMRHGDDSSSSSPSLWGTQTPTTTNLLAIETILCEDFLSFSVRRHPSSSLLSSSSASASLQPSPAPAPVGPLCLRTRLRFRPRPKPLPLQANSRPPRRSQTPSRLGIATDSAEVGALPDQPLDPRPRHATTRARASRTRPRSALGRPRRMLLLRQCEHPQSTRILLLIPPSLACVPSTAGRGRLTLPI
jgi:hypothetical protein